MAKRSNAVTTRRAEAQLDSFDPETRTFSAVAATETPVNRSSYSVGNYQEILLCTPAAVRLGHMPSGRAPIPFDTHQAFSSRDQLGVVTDARIEGRKLIIDGQLSARDDVAAIAQDMAAGIIRNVSVGYFTHARTQSEGSDGSLTLIRTDWEPVEVSIVPISTDSKLTFEATRKVPRWQFARNRPPAGPPPLHLLAARQIKSTTR